MRIPMKPLLCAVGLAALAACTSGSSREFYSEAGAEVDQGTFGNATMQNMLAQMCTGQAKGYIVPDPIVVLHPSSTPANPVYYRGNVRCLSGLNGKYAEVIFREYVQSATELPTIEQADAEGGG